MTKANEYFEQAIREELPSVGAGVFGALPNDFGRAIERYAELCQANGICPKCQEPLDDCICDDD